MKYEIYKKLNNVEREYYEKEICYSETASLSFVLMVGISVVSVILLGLERTGLKMLLIGLLGYIFITFSEVVVKIIRENMWLDSLGYKTMRIEDGKSRR